MTGPPRTAAWLSYGAYANVKTDDDRCQQPLLVWPHYTMCRRASNKLSFFSQFRSTYHNSPKLHARHTYAVILISLAVRIIYSKDMNDNKF